MHHAEELETAKEASIRLEKQYDLALGDLRGELATAQVVIRRISMHFNALSRIFHAIRRGKSQRLTGNFLECKGKQRA